jgi:hypothetical protein
VWSVLDDPTPVSKVTSSVLVGTCWGFQLVVVPQDPLFGEFQLIGVATAALAALARTAAMT